MKVTKCALPGCKNTTPRVEGWAVGWRPLCKDHQGETHLWPEARFTQEGNAVRGDSSKPKTV